MADGFPALPALGRHARPGRHGVSAGPAGLTLRERTGLELVELAALRGRTDALAEAVRGAFGVELPAVPRFVAAAGGIGLAWSGAGQWTVRGPEGEGLEARLRPLAAGRAALTAQGDGRVVLQLGGPAVRDVLARLVPVDLHPAVFRPGDVALTLAGHVGVALRAEDDDGFELVAFRSYARSLFDAVLEAGLAVGAEVLPTA